MIKSLTDMSASSLAELITENPDNINSYIEQLKTLPDDYLNKLFENMPYTTLFKFREKGFNDMISDELLMKRMRSEENEYREAFAIRRDQDTRLKYPYLMCTSVFDNLRDFQCREETKFEKSIPKIFEHQWDLPSLLSKKQTEGVDSVLSVVPSIREFRRRFNLFTADQLSSLNWNNVLVAGGSVLACAMSHNTLKDQSKTQMRQFFLDQFPSSDIDLFIYGLNEEEANQKIKEIYNAVCDENPNDVLVVRTKHAVSFVSKDPFRHIQVILRLYKSPAEVLMGFDIDSCAIGYDGEKVWTLPRGQRSLNLRWNLLDKDRRSLTYEYRLVKYAKRGFAVAIPGFQPEKVKPEVYDETFTGEGTALKNIKGLKLLLLFEAKDKKPSWNRGFLYSNANKINDTEKYKESVLEAESDYSAVFLPWHPAWDAHRIAKHLTREDFSRQYGKGEYGKLEVHSFDIDDIFQELDRSETREEFLSGKLNWVTVNPGSQTVGSFHPLPAENFEDGAYITEPTTRYSVKLTSASIAPRMEDFLRINDYPMPTSSNIPVVIDNLSKEKVEKFKTENNNWPGMEVNEYKVNP
eukprot:gb/GECH01000541.1/.p1 GENE.gb/GECH01000541.1/~~gb/GECH01000541.1/.p1  ORF type:complete len:579 (+),score=148.37 gb/GECH01000541.1/:1-1737(+)